MQLEPCLLVPPPPQIWAESSCSMGGLIPLPGRMAVGKDASFRSLGFPPSMKSDVMDPHLFIRKNGSECWVPEEKALLETSGCLGGKGALRPHFRL